MAIRNLVFVLLVLSTASSAWASGAEMVWRRVGNDLTEEQGVGAHHERFILDSRGHVLAAFLHGSKSYLAVPKGEGWQSVALPFASPAYDAELEKDGAIKALGRDDRTGKVLLGQFNPIKKSWTILVETTEALTPARNPDTVLGKITPAGNGFFVLYPSHASRGEWSLVKYEAGRLAQVASPLPIGLSESVELLLGRAGKPIVLWVRWDAANVAELSNAGWSQWQSPARDKTYRAFMRILPKGGLQVAYFHDDDREAQVLSLFEGDNVSKLKLAWTSPLLKTINSFADVYVSPAGNAFVIPCRSSATKPGEPLRLYSIARGKAWKEFPALPLEDCTHRATLASRNGEPILLANENSRLSVLALQPPLPSRPSETSAPARVFFVSPVEPKKVKVQFAEFWGQEKVDRANFPTRLHFIGSAGLTKGELAKVEAVSQDGVKLWYGLYSLDRTVGEPAAAILPVGTMAKLKRMSLVFQPVSEKSKVPLIRKLASGLSKVGNENEGRRAPYSIGEVAGAETLLDRDGKPLCKLSQCQVKQAGEIYMLSWGEGEYKTDYVYRNAVSGVFESSPSFDFEFEMGGKPAFVFTGCLPGEGCKIVLWYERNGKIAKAVAGENIVLP